MKLPPQVELSLAALFLELPSSVASAHEQLVREAWAKSHAESFRVLVFKHNDPIQSTVHRAENLAHPEHCNATLVMDPGTPVVGVG